MTLQCSGQISAIDINREYRRYSGNGYQGRFALATDGAPLLGPPYSTTGRIAYSDFHCASFASSAVGEGGDFVTEKNGYKHHVFTSNGRFCITKAGTGTHQIRHLIVAGAAGGGGGGVTGNDKSETGGGGGAGAFVDSGSSTEIPNTVACHPVYVGTGGAGGTAYPLGRGGTGGNSSISITGGLWRIAYGGGQGGAVIYGGDFGGMNGGCGGGGAGKFYADYLTGSGTGTQGFDGGNGGKASGGGGGARGRGNNYSNVNGGSGGGGLKYTIYDNNEYSVGGGGGGQTGGSGYNIAGRGGDQPALSSGAATSPTRYGCGGGGGGSYNMGATGERGTGGYQGIVIISIKQ